MKHTKGFLAKWGDLILFSENVDITMLFFIQYFGVKNIVCEKYNTYLQLLPEKVNKRWLGLVLALLSTYSQSSTSSGFFIVCCRNIS